MPPIPSNKDQILALRAAQLEAGHGRNTRAQYRHWMLRYRRARIQGTCRSLQGFLTHLTTVEELNPKTIHQALCALKFYHEKVLGIPIAENSLTIPPINRNRNHPAFLSAPQAHSLLSHLSGLAQLQASFLIGTGSRITAMLQLRLKDIDLHAGTVCFRFDKGRKSRSVRLPQSIIPALAAQIEASRAQWKLDRAAGIMTGIDDPSLTRKPGKSLGTLPWYWLFPSQSVRQGIRWHATDRCLSDSLKVAATAAGITARVTPHSLRHTNATLLLEQGANIRRIQEHLGHTHLETTEIYLHATAVDGLTSPLDRLPATILFPSSLHHQATA